MRLYVQELKRILKSTRARVVIILAIFLPMLMAVLASEFNDADYLDSNGDKVYLHGTAALSMIKESSSAGNGEATVEQLKNALRTYQSLYEETGIDPIGGDFPLERYWQDVKPIASRLRLITQTYSKVNEPFDLRTISVDSLDSFYDDTEKKLTSVMESDQILRDPAMIAKAQQLFHKVNIPFYISHGYTRDAFDYIEFAVLILVILSAVLAAPVFSERYSSGEDSILRCTVCGRSKLVITTILAELTVVTVTYFIGIGLHLLISDKIFGIETLKESVQSLYTVYSLPNMNLLELQIVLAFSGWLCCMAVTTMSLCISAKATETSTSMVLSLIMVILPTLLYSISGGANWLLALFPSASVGLSNNMLMSLVDLRFLMLGSTAVWYPTVLVSTAIVEFLLFAFISHIMYAKHQVTK
ncbi:ABC transporter permease subunit [uncultured Ruminococcus sp.]|uniref:ABC transporter permease subunit n=1 Tax=uncultured Ruminococcus sp. TaxID=165186 RepID=UPI0025EE842A|nr:ABC transporter permease subunit [uncultured Ruminococcus sp.]